MDKSKIREYLKNSIEPEKLSSILSYIISRDNIDRFRYLMNETSKYKYDLALFLISREVASIDEILDENNEIKISESDLETAAIFELGLYDVPATGRMLDLKRNFFYETPKYLYHGRRDILSYKDEENIKEEIEKILTDAIIKEYSSDGRLEGRFLEILNGDAIDSEAITTGMTEYAKTCFLDDLSTIGIDITFDEFYKLFVKINNNSAEVYGKNIGIFSFLLNYIEMNNWDDIAELDFLDNSPFYYSKVKSKITEHRDKFRLLSSLIINLQRLLKERTINYTK